MEDTESQLASHIKIAKHIGLTDSQIGDILKLTNSLNKGGDFGLGEENKAYAKYFIGKSYLKPLTFDSIDTSNFTFEPGCRNNWHIHHKRGQIILVTAGRGYYQEWGKQPRELKAGDVLDIPPEVKHWHGATKDSWFSHISIIVPREGSFTEWLEEVSDDEYNSYYKDITTNNRI